MKYLRFRQLWRPEFPLDGALLLQQPHLVWKKFHYHLQERKQFSSGIGAKYVLPDGAAVRAKINNKSEV